MNLNSLAPQDADYINRSGFSEANPSDYEPGLFEGAGRGLLSGIETGASIASQVGVKSVIATNLEQFKLLHPEAADAILSPVNDAIDNSYGNFRKSVAPNPETTGKAGQILFGLGEYTPALAGSVINPILGAGIAQQISQTATKEELLNKGVKREDAERIALARSVVDAAGFLLPVTIGGSLYTRLASGATINIGAGMASREITSIMLGNANYSALANQYKAWDAESVIVDGVLGAAFGGAYHYAARRAEVNAIPDSRAEISTENIKQSDIDSSLSLNEAHNYDVGSSPILHGTADSMTAHYRAMSDATDAINRGEPVSVSSHADSFDGAIRPEGFSESARPEMESALHDSDISTNIQERATARTPSETIAEGENQYAQFMADEGSVDPDTGINIGNSYELATASRIATEFPDLIVEHPDTGQQVKLSELLDEYNEQIATKQDVSDVYPFVASCMLRNSE